MVMRPRSSPRPPPLRLSPPPSLSHAQPRHGYTACTVCAQSHAALPWVLERVGGEEELRQLYRPRQVPCISYEALLRKHNMTVIHHMKVDAEVCAYPGTRVQMKRHSRARGRCRSTSPIPNRTHTHALYALAQPQPSNSSNSLLHGLVPCGIIICRVPTWRSSERPWPAHERHACGLGASISSTSTHKRSSNQVNN